MIARQAPAPFLRRMVMPCVAALLCAVAITSCFRHEQKQVSTAGEHVTDGYAPGVTPPPAMQVRLEPVRVLDTTMSADVSGGAPMTFVFSLDTARVHPAGTKFDRVQAFTWSAQDSSWREAQSDTFAFGVQRSMSDVTGDGKPDLVIITSTGVDDSIAAIGCVIASAHGGVWKEVLTVQTGNPTFEDIDHNGSSDVLVHDTYTGAMPATDAIDYVSEIYSFDGAAFSSAKQKFPKYFDALITKATEEYSKLKTLIPVTSPITDEFDFTLYRPCAAVIVAYHAAGNIDGARGFWSREKEFLSRMLPSGQFIDLEAFAATQ